MESKEEEKVPRGYIARWQPWLNATEQKPENFFLPFGWDIKIDAPSVGYSKKSNPGPRQKKEKSSQEDCCTHFHFFHDGAKKYFYRQHSVDKIEHNFLFFYKDFFSLHPVPSEFLNWNKDVLGKLSLFIRNEQKKQLQLWRGGKKSLYWLTYSEPFISIENAAYLLFG